MNKWNCELRKAPEKITVGTKLHLYCEGKIPAALGEELTILFAKKEDAYKLHFLKILYKSEDHLDLQVTSYRPGNFNSSFTITDGSYNFFVNNLSFKVDTVLSKKESIQAHGAFGPWKEPIPPLYLASWIVNICVFLFLGFFLTRRYLKRKKLFEIVIRRLKKHSPSKIFIKNLRKMQKDSLKYVSDLEKLFKNYLENLFFISCIERKTFYILNDLKRYENLIYKKYGNDIRQLLNELDNFKNQKVNEEIQFQLERGCKNLVFSLEREKK